MTSSFIALLTLHITFSCGQQNDGGPDKMNDLIGQLAAYVITRCSCDLTTEHISNSRWVCDSNRPDVVIFRADVTGTTTINRTEIASYIMQWADTQNIINVGSVNLPLQGSNQCQDQDCMVTGPPATGTTTTTTTGTPASPVTPPYWIFGIIGVIILILILIIVVVLIVVCRKNSQQHKSAP